LGALLRAAGGLAEFGAAAAGQRGVAEAAGLVAEELAEAAAQVGVVLGDVAAGGRALQQNRLDLADRFKAGGDALSPRTLLVEFSEDGADESPWVLSTFGCEEQPWSEGAVSDPNRDALSEQLDRALEEAMEAAYGDWMWGEEENEEFAEVCEELARLTPLIVTDDTGFSAGEDEEEFSEAPARLPPPPGGRLVERTRVRGSRLSPLDLPPFGGADGDREQADALIGSLAGNIARFLRGEPGVRWGPGLLMGSRFALKAKLLRLVAGCPDRGLGAVSEERRSEILGCVEELEALGMPVGEVPVKGERPRLPQAIFGRWCLTYTNSNLAPLLLAVLPLLECGSVVQDFLPQDDAPGRPVVVTTTAELEPKGLGLLSGGALPPLALLRALGLGLPRWGGEGGTEAARLVVTAEVTAGWGGAMEVRPIGARLLAPGATDGPSVSLPSLLAPATAWSTTFVDEEARVMRSPFGEVFVFIRDV